MFGNIAVVGPVRCQRAKGLQRVVAFRKLYKQRESVDTRTGLRENLHRTGNYRRTTIYRNKCTRIGRSRAAND